MSVTRSPVLGTSTPPFHTPTVPLVMTLPTPPTTKNHAALLPLGPGRMPCPCTSAAHFAARVRPTAWSVCGAAPSATLLEEAKLTRPPPSSYVEPTPSPIIPGNPPVTTPSTDPLAEVLPSPRPSHRCGLPHYLPATTSTPPATSKTIHPIGETVSSIFPRIKSYIIHAILLGTFKWSSSTTSFHAIRLHKYVYDNKVHSPIEWANGPQVFAIHLFSLESLYKFSAIRDYAFNYLRKALFDVNIIFGVVDTIDYTTFLSPYPLHRDDRAKPKTTSAATNPTKPRLSNTSCNNWNLNLPCVKNPCPWKHVCSTTVSTPSTGLRPPSPPSDALSSATAASPPPYETTSAAVSLSQIYPHTHIQGDPKGPFLDHSDINTSSPHASSTAHKPPPRPNTTLRQPLTTGPTSPAWSARFSTSHPTPPPTFDRTVWAAEFADYPDQPLVTSLLDAITFGVRLGSISSRSPLTGPNLSCEVLSSGLLC
ncbi:hypothetical protein BC829DRAFT_448118 [Chytridium lagenaria]|nr:hypothetical protein BC829DRAFT_448118 [Chytridium lagenaria]